MYRALDTQLERSSSNGRLRVDRAVGVRADSRFSLQQALQAAALSPEREAIILLAPHATLIHHAHHLRKALALTPAASQRCILAWIPVCSPWDGNDHDHHQDQKYDTNPARVEAASLLAWPHPLFAGSVGESSFCAGLPFVSVRPGFSVCVGDDVGATREAVAAFLGSAVCDGVARCLFVMPDLHEWASVAGAEAFIGWVAWVRALTRMRKIIVDGIISASFAADDTSFIFEYLQSASDVLVDVSPLETGYARDVHGQIIITHTTELATTQKVLHYKLGETSSSFFPPGAKDLASSV